MSFYPILSSTIEPIAGTVYVVGVSHTLEKNLQPLWETLSTDEQQRALRYKYPHLQQRFIKFRASLRQVLSRFIHISPSDIQFSYTDNKKPYVTNSLDVRFNISHSENEAVIAFTIGADIGVDIEKIKPINTASLANRFFSSVEKNYLNTLPEAQQLLAFYAIWAEKEAFIKATGLGLKQSLQSFSVALDPPALIQAEGYTAEKWHIQQFIWKPEFISAVAMEAAINQLQVYRLWP